MFLYIILFCTQAFLIENISGQCIGNVGSPYKVESPCGKYELPKQCGCANAQWPRAQLSIADSSIVSASDGGSLNVQTSSSIAPGSISILSENQIQGPLSVYGTLPFLSAVALEGSLPTQGSGAVAYQCGDGRVAILEENISGSNYFDAGILGGNLNSFGTGWNSAGYGINGNIGCATNTYSSGYGCKAINSIPCGY